MNGQIIVYLKSNHRMPVQAVPCRHLRDLQQDIPANWCPGCGAEIFDADSVLCRRCKGEMSYE